MGCLNDKTLTTPPGVLRNIIWKWDDHDMTIMVICWWWFDTAHPGVLRFWGVEEYHMMIMIWWYDDDHLPPRCVVRNSEGSIVSRQARLRAVIWNEYQVTVFVFVFVFVFINEYPRIFMYPNMWSLYDQVSVYNVFVERGNVAVLQCGVPASVRDSVEVSVGGSILKERLQWDELGCHQDTQNQEVQVLMF